MDAFERTRRLLGPEAIRAIKGSGVAVFGLGGVGSFALEALARLGIGKFLLIDHDHIEASNLNRQLLALHSTLGRLKVEVAAERILDINPDTSITTLPQRCTAENIRSMLNAADGIEYIIDAIDDVPAKAAIIKEALARNVFCVSVMGTGNKMDPQKFMVRPMKNSSGCPLARAVRKRLREVAAAGEIPVVFSEEVPGEHLQPPGTVSFVPAAAGLLAASVLVRQLLSRQRLETGRG